ncbi:hypothetical protein TOPH_03456 [Tolypocladium ophioglossoides CBS 100239]|uniref:Uncharacterized protein n=1 Tax=Tolypocladium ophioglossoides (strain CBS 100239) TaxID=1163406 RepID=A0A0L0NCY8_TOLOC|nr:hypothetical protein TOPH_03456 [Tolypocladium ophioglossoides CBS 100239]
MSNRFKRSSEVPQIAHVEDAPDDDTGSSVEGIQSTGKYAMSEAPAKERPNTGKSRSDKRPAVSRSGSSSAGAGLTDSDSTARSSEKKGKDPRRPSRRDIIDPQQQRDQYREQRRREQRAKDEDEDRRARAAARDRESKALRKTRPPAPKHSTVQPVVQQAGDQRGRIEDPAYYGVKQPAASGSRPRAQTRPASYYAGQPGGPEMMNPGWQASQRPPAPFPVGSFPPPQLWPGAGPCPAGYRPPPPSPGGPAPGFHDSPHSHLRHRFDNRPSSAMGFRGQPALEYHQEEHPEDLAPRVSRRTSRPPQRLDEDARRMPPPKYIPTRPQSALPPTTPFRPPPTQPRQNQSRPPPAHRKSIGFEEPRYGAGDLYDDDDDDDDDDDGDEGLFHDTSPNASYEQRRVVVARQRRGSVAYEQQEYDIVPASGRGRRSSMYGALGGGGVSLGSENKMNAAMKYQDEVSGGAQMPLTAEMLRKAMRRGGVPSSRSTRSSGSRDESEYKRSNTTGITQSSYGNEEFTIKVPGNTVVRLQGAEIECSKEGGEITWSSRLSGSRAGSDRPSTIYQQLEDSRRIEDGRRSEDSRRLEDLRSRMGKALPLRPRAPSQADSQSRGYAPTHAPYEPYAHGNFI